MQDDPFNAYYCQPGIKYIESVWKLLTRYAVVGHTTQDKALITACGKAAALVYDYPSQVTPVKAYFDVLLDNKTTPHEKV
jgi:hypothetical protein